MSMSEFNRWLDIAASDGVISGDEERALIERAQALGIDDASATLLIEHRRQRAAAEPPKCPSCRQPLTDAEVTLICPNCKADIGAVRGRNTEASGIISLLNSTEDAVTAVASIHIPKAIKAKSPLHGVFVQTLAKADSAVSKLERHYGANPMVVEMSQAYRVRLAELDNNYKTASKRAGRRFIVPLMIGLVVISAIVGFYFYTAESQKSRVSYLTSEFDRFIAQKKYDSAEAIYKIMRSEKIEAAMKNKTFESNGSITKIPELYTVLMNEKALNWLNPIVEKLQQYSEGGPYDSCYVLLKKLDTEWRSYPTTNSELGRYGEDNTLAVIEDLRETTENRMFDYELQNGTLAEALKILSKVTASDRRKVMLQHAVEYLRETNRIDDAAQVASLLRE
jgi:hypothetical protein